MELSYLRAFLAVAEELHFGRAAQRLHTAQPPLSRTIKNLERALGTRLFDRNTRSVRLTTSGQALVEPAREVFAALERAQLAVKNADHGEVGLVRIAFAGVSTHRLVADLSRELRLRKPGIQLEFRSQTWAMPAIRELLDDQVDIAFGWWDLVPPDIALRVVREDALVMAVPDTHTTANRPEAPMADFAHDSFVTLPQREGAVLPDRLRRLAYEAGFAPNVVQVAPDTQTALALVDAEVGSHLTLRSVAESVGTDSHLAFVPLADTPRDSDGSPLSVNLQMAWRRDDPSPAVHSALDVVLELIGS